VSRLLSWLTRRVAPGRAERAATAPADAYPLDATGWGTGGWPL
jgi:hypothetical protein